MSDYALNLTMIAEEMAYDIFDIDEIVQHVKDNDTVERINILIEALFRGDGLDDAAGD